MTHVRVLPGRGERGWQPDSGEQRGEANAGWGGAGDVESH